MVWSGLIWLAPHCVLDCPLCVDSWVVRGLFFIHRVTMADTMADNHSSPRIYIGFQTGKSRGTRGLTLVYVRRVCIGFKRRGV